MSTDVNLSKDDREVILMILNYWIENIPQEETDKDTYLTAIKLRTEFLKLCPWLVQ